MKQKIYIETSIPSFYYEMRTDPEMIARRNWTREWWDKHSERFELVTSEPVLDELEGGDYPNKNDVVHFLDNVLLLTVEEEITAIVSAYIVNKAMPKDPTGDALHLALASYHKCDFLLTWNCNHLANANKFGHIRSVNAMLGLFTPNLVTPYQLLGGR